MYLCTYNIFCFVEKKKRYGEKTILVSVCILSRYTQDLHTCFGFSGMDLDRNNTLSSILWTTTFACAKLICQIKKCQTYFHTSTLPILLLEQRELMTKVHECAEFHFFLFSAKSLSQTRIIEYWALACWRTSQTK